MLNWSNSERNAFLRGLDTIEQVLVTFGRLLLGLLIAGIIAGASFVIVKRPWGAGNQGEWFYFAVAVLLALGWCIGQFTSLGARRRSRNAGISVESQTVDGGRQWTFQFGSPAAIPDSIPVTDDDGLLRFSHGFQVPLAALASEVLPDDRALSRLCEELAHGATLDDACRSVQPEYLSWNGLQRRAYQLYVSSRLQQDTVHQ